MASVIAESHSQTLSYFRRDPIGLAVEKSGSDWSIVIPPCGFWKMLRQLAIVYGPIVSILGMLIGFGQEGWRITFSSSLGAIEGTAGLACLYLPIFIGMAFLIGRGRVSIECRGGTIK